MAPAARYSTITTIWGFSWLNSIALWTSHTSSRPYRKSGRLILAFFNVESLNKKERSINIEVYIMGWFSIWVIWDSSCFHELRPWNYGIELHNSKPSVPWFIITIHNISHYNASDEPIFHDKGQIKRSKRLSMWVAQPSHEFVPTPESWSIVN